MKRVKKLLQRIIIFTRNNCGNFCFLCVFTAFLYTNILLTNYLMKLDVTSSYNNTPYNAYAITFLIDTKNNTPLDLSKIINNNILNECVLFKYNPEVQSIYEIIYCSQNAIEFHDLLAWNWDFISKEKIAVVGIDSIYHPGDFFLKDEKSYLVKGTLERHISEAVNYGIFYTNCNLDCVDTQYSFVLTSKSSQGVKQAFKKLKEALLNEKIEIKEIDIRNAEFNDYIKYDNTMGFILIILVLFYVLLLFIAKKMWLIYKKPEIVVLTILGDKKLQAKVYLEYLAIWFCAIIISAMLVFFTIDIFYFGFLPVLSVTLGIVGMILLTVIPMCFPQKNHI